MKLAILSILPLLTSPFVLQTHHKYSPKTELHAIGVFVRKAKEASLREYITSGKLSPEVKDETAKISAALNDKYELQPDKPIGFVQQSLTKRKGTLTVIAEYKRKFEDESAPFISGEIFDATVLSPVFREGGAAAIAVMADEKFGGCSYEDIVKVVQEQESVKGEIPGPLPVISSDIIIDELQIAQAKVAGANAVTVSYGVVGFDSLQTLLKAAQIADVEVIVNVSTADEAQKAVDAGATLICVTNIDGAENKFEVIKTLDTAEKQVCKIAAILAKDNKQLEEVEESWVLRDMGFNAVWVSDCLYKAGNDPVEHPGAIIKSMKQKSSVKYASARVKTGKGEGAREYLGDIMM